VARFSGPIAGGRKLAGKGFSTGLTAVIRPRLPGLARNAPAGGRQARPDLTQGKSGKKSVSAVIWANHLYRTAAIGPSARPWMNCCT
jgi:hypothetical protein